MPLRSCHTVRRSRRSPMFVFALPCTMELLASSHMFRRNEYACLKLVCLLVDRKSIANNCNHWRLKNLPRNMSNLERQLQDVPTGVDLTYLGLVPSGWAYRAPGQYLVRCLFFDCVDAITFTETTRSASLSWHLYTCQFVWFCW